MIDDDDDEHRLVSNVQLVAELGVAATQRRET